MTALKLARAALVGLALHAESALRNAQVLLLHGPSRWRQRLGLCRASRGPSQGQALA